MYIANVLSTEYGVKCSEREIGARKGKIYNEMQYICLAFKKNTRKRHPVILMQD